MGFSVAEITSGVDETGEFGRPFLGGLWGCAITSVLKVVSIWNPTGESAYGIVNATGFCLKLMGIFDYYVKLCH